MIREPRPGILRRGPGAFAVIHLVPAAMRGAHLHHEDRDGQARLPLAVNVLADRVAEDLAAQADFLPGLVQGGFLRRGTAVDEPFGNGPGLGPLPAHQTDLEALTPTTDGDDAYLLRHADGAPLIRAGTFRFGLRATSSPRVR